MWQSIFREIYEGLDKETVKVRFQYFHQVGVDNTIVLLLYFWFSLRGNMKHEQMKVKAEKIWMATAAAKRDSGEA